MKQLIAIVSSLLLFHLTTSSAFQIIDEGGQLDLDYVAKKVCWANSGSRNQISKFSTIRKLIDYFEDLPAEHQYSSCANLNLGILGQLHTLTQVGNDDVCGHQKLALLEAFHRNYIAEHRSRQVAELPKVLKTFFLQYSTHISNICAKRSHDYFRNREVDLGEAQNADLDDLLEKYSSATGHSKELKSYDDVYLIWGLVDGLPKGAQGRMGDYLTTGPKRLVIRLWESENLERVQSICSTSLKPLYSRTILPTLRLVNLGYYPKERHFLQQINEHPLVKRLYKLALLCETLLPILALKNDPTDHQVYILKPELVELPEPDDKPELKVIDPVPWEGDLLPPVVEPGAQKEASRASDNAKSRAASIGRTIKFIARNIRKRSCSEIILLGSDESVEKQVEDAIRGVGGVDTLWRRKRSVVKFFRGVLMVFEIVYYAFLLTIFFIIDLVLGVLIFIGNLFTEICKGLLALSATLENAFVWGATEH